MKTLSRRPMVGLATFFLAGIWFGLRHAAPYPGCIWLAAALTAVAAVSCFPHWESGTAGRMRSGFIDLVGTVGILGSVFLLAWLNADLRTPRSAATLDGYLNSTGTWVEAVGVITDQPEQPSSRARGQTWTFPFRLEQVRRSNEKEWHAIRETIRVRYFADTRQPPSYGEQWRLYGRLSQFIPAGGTRSPRHALIYLSAQARWAHYRSAGHGSWIVQKCLEARAAARRLLVRGIEDHDEAVDILESLLLGYRSQMPRDLYGIFAATGTLHIFAISGSHVVVSVCEYLKPRII